MASFDNFFLSLLQSQRPISMKKENIQSRNRKLSAKSRKKHNSFTADMLKPFEKMYSSYGMSSAASMGLNPQSAMSSGMASASYYMPPQQAASAASTMHSQFPGAAAASMHHMATPFASSFGGMVSFFKVLRERSERSPISLVACPVQFVKMVK